MGEKCEEKKAEEQVFEPDPNEASAGRREFAALMELEGGPTFVSTVCTDEQLLKMLDTDPGARYLGEFAIGTNRDINQFTGNILFDEKIGGSFHMALGAGYPETGSKNKSAIHWDLICDVRRDSEIQVDGLPFYKDGKFVFGQ